MSSIKLSPNASGTGIFTVAAPNSNTDRTLNLPDQSGTIISTDSSGAVILPRVDTTNEGGQINFNRASDNTAVWSIDSFGSTSTPTLRFINGATVAAAIDGSNNVGIGTSSPNAKVDVSGSVNITADSGLNGTWSGLSTRYIPGNNSAYLQSVALSGGAVTGGKELSFDASQTLFRTISGSTFTERMRIDSSGNLLVGTSSGSGERLNVSFTGTQGIRLNTTSTAASLAVQFVYNNSTEVGKISTTTTSTSYNTTSDYRLKEQVQPLQGALAKVQALKPCTYKWKADGSDGEGFIAHELAEVVPQCVTGEKDAVDADGNPVYQGIDTSFLVATLTAAIQEQQAIIESLTTRIAALEAR